MIEILILFQKKRHSLLAELSDRLYDVRGKVEEATGVPRKLQKLILKGNLLEGDDSTLQELGVPDKKSVQFLLVGSSEEEVEAVEKLQDDPTLMPFEQGRGKVRRKYEAKIAPTTKSYKYGFGRIEALAGLENEAQAAELLERLSTDRGVAEVMEKHEWKVGALKEMYPSGKVGVDPVCVLGYNVNAGAEIHIRLRTDDLKGFRPYWKLLEVMYHELSHNVHRDHNREFYELMHQLEREAKQLDWTQNEGKSVSGASVAPNDAQLTSESEMAAGSRVGGSRAMMKTISASEAARRAALSRFEASNNGSMPQVIQDARYVEQPGKRKSEDKVNTASVGRNTQQNSDITRHGQAAHSENAPIRPPAEKQQRSPAAPVGRNPQQDSGFPNSRTTVSNEDTIRPPEEQQRSENEKKKRIQELPQMSTESSEKEDPQISAPANAPSENDHDHDVALELLTQLGFDRSEASSALHNTNNNPDQAANWIMSRQSAVPSSAQNPTPIDVDALPDPVEPETHPTLKQFDNELADLMAMGFSHTSASQAIQSCSGNVEAAVNWIVSRGMS